MEDSEGEFSGPVNSGQIYKGIMSSDTSSEMNDIDVQVGQKRAREVMTTLAELRQRLVYEGDLSEESQNLYTQIEQTLHQAIGELYGWKSETTDHQETENQESEGDQRGDHREPQDRDDD